MDNFKIDKYGTKRWYKDGKFHREDGPAVEKANGDKSWYKEGQLHREDGPAIERVNEYKSWYLNNIFIYKYISKNSILDKTYEETFNKLFIGSEKVEIINLRNAFDLIDIEVFLNE